MERERIVDGVWVFRSRFAEMLSTLIDMGRGRAVLVDPPMFADEAAGIQGFAQGEGLRIEYLVVTHAHGDHAYGTAHFPETPIIAHTGFWEFWREVEAADRGFFSRFLPGYEPPRVRPPNFLLADGSRIVFGRELVLRHVPGHSPDGILLEIPGEGIWIAGDTVIPVPLISSGSLRGLRETLRGLLEAFPGGILVPGHGGVLRGDAAREAIAANLEYLRRLEEAVERAITAGMGLGELLSSPLDRLGLTAGRPNAVELWIHRENLKRAYAELSGR